MTAPPPGFPPADDGRPSTSAAYQGTEYPHGYSSGPTRLPPAPLPYPVGSQPLPPRPRAPRSSPIVAPLLALVGLVLVAAVSWVGLGLVNATFDEAAAAAPTATPAGLIGAAASEPPEDGVAATVPPEEIEPTDPPMIIEAPPGATADVEGIIAFTRGGDVWTASGTGPELHRLTDADSTRSDSSPAWTSDGKQMYFIRTTKRDTKNSRPGGKYTLYVTDLMRMKADGSDRRKVYDALIKGSSGLWFSHVLQPSVSPNGRMVAVVSDGPDGSGPVELHLINSKTGRMSKVAVPAEGELGHNSPAFSPDGKRIAFTYNAASGTNGAPRIGIHTCKSRSNCTQGKTKLLKAGFANPAWSPDGKWLAVEATNGNGRDIAIISSGQGDVKVELTKDGSSFAPVVSPRGNQVAYLHRDGTAIDVRIATLEFDDRGNPTLVDDRAITIDGLIDADSRPSWFMPAPRDPGTTSDDPEAATSPAPPSEGTDASLEGAPPPPGS